MKFIAQGTILSKVNCHNERRVHARRLNKSLEEVPLMFGSLRMGVNVICFDNDSYRIDKTSKAQNISEERLVLEISFKLNPDGTVCDEYDIVNNLVKGGTYELTMEDAFISKHHYLKFISGKANRTIKSYFIKSWADRINLLSTPSLRPGNLTIEPREVVKKVCSDKQLLIA